MDLEAEIAKLQSDNSKLNKELKRVVGEYHRLHKKFKGEERDHKKTREELEKVIKTLKAERAKAADGMVRGSRGFPLTRRRLD